MFSDVEVLARGLLLGEGPVWHADTQTLFYVDIDAQKIYALNYKTRQTTCYETHAQVGCVVMTQGGALLAAVKDTLVSIDITTGEQTAVQRLPFPDFLRFNDGKCDASGRLWVGTMALKQGTARAKGGGSLYCIDDGVMVAQYSGFTISNGMAWSADNAIFYHIDTPTGQVDAYDLNEHGLLCNRRTAVTFNSADGTPDGMCIDTDGNLWVAMWGGGQVLCVSPTSGKVLHRLVVQDKNVSCCVFGGQTMQTLFITTAQDEKGRGGNLFAVRTQATGVKSFQYKGVSQ